jgi:hypothetical protein
MAMRMTRATLRDKQRRYTASAKSGRISLTAPTSKHPFESAQPYIKELSPTGGGSEAVFSNSTRRWTKRTKDAKFTWNMTLATRPWPLEGRRQCYGHCTISCAAYLIILVHCTIVMSASSVSQLHLEYKTRALPLRERQRTVCQTTYYLLLFPCSSSHSSHGLHRTLSQIPTIITAGIRNPAGSPGWGMNALWGYVAACQSNPPTYGMEYGVWSMEYGVQIA